MTPRESRGYRNKNPGNIDYVPANMWQGQTGKEPNGRFAIFDSHENGIRALALLLTTYQDRHGLRTVRGIISRWAPSTENNTRAYVYAVAERMNRGPDEQVDLHCYKDMRPMVEAIITHELGGNPYPDRSIDEGLRRAGVVAELKSAADVLAKTDTGKAAVGVGAAGTVAALAQAAPAVQALGYVGPVVGVVLVIAAVVLFILWRKGKI